ncbi:uncharacterized protein [Clytia hemisphaerica]|uniref:Uncharacterized protein n=1 Tax=Clytia hemisphaerica TaxID=252671 RepID=A0A7M5WWB8_9CNID
MKSIINFSFNFLQIIFIYFFYLITRPIKYFLTKNNAAIVDNLTPKPSLIKNDADPTDNPLVEKRTLGELGVYSDPNLANGSKPKQKSFKKEPIATPNTKPPTEMKKKILQENLDQLNKSLLQAASSLSGDSGITMEQLDSLVKTYLASKQLIERPNGNSIPVPSAESLLSTPSSREVIENYTAGHDDLPKDSSVESITQSNEYVQKIFSSGDQAKSGPVLPEALLEKLATDIISKVDNHLDSKFQKMEEKYSNEHSELVKCVSTSLSTIKTGQEQNIKLQSQMTDFHKALNEIKQKQMETESLIRNKVCEDNSAKEISREVPTQTSYPETRDIGIVTHAMTKKENDEAESIEISNLKEDIESFTNHIVRQDREKAELKACIEQLKVANKEANLSLLALKSQTTQRERLNSVNEDDRRELENVITQQKQRLSNLIQEKTEMATSFENEKIKIGNESALKELAFKEEIASLMRDSENITNELNNARLEMESLKKSNDAVNALIETLESESNEKSIKIASLSDQLDSVTDLLKNKEQEIREKYSKFNERLLNDEILALKGELHDKKSEISRLNALCRSFNSDLDTKQHLLDKRTASFDQKYDRLERHLSNTNNDLVRVRNEKLNLIEQRDNLKNRLEESQTELTTIKSKHSCDASETSCDKVDPKSSTESLVESDGRQNENHESTSEATLPSNVKSETSSNESFVTKFAESAVIDHGNKSNADASETSCDKVDHKSLPESLVESDNHQNEDHESAPQATLPSTVKTEITSNQSFVTKSAEIAVIDHVNDLTADASETSCDKVDHKSSTESLVEPDGRQNEDHESAPQATLPSTVKTEITSNESFVTKAAEIAVIDHVNDLTADASETSCDKVDHKSSTESLVEPDGRQNEDHESAPQATLPSTVKTQITSNESFVTKAAESAVIDHVNKSNADASETICDKVEHKSSTESLVEPDGRQNEDHESAPQATLPSSVKTQITSNRSFVTRFKGSMSILTGGLSWFIGSGKELPNTPDQPKSCKDTTNGSNMKTTGPSTTMSSVNDGVEPYFEPHSKDDADKNLRDGTSDDEDEFHDSVEKLELKSPPNVCEKVSINTGPDAIMDPEQPKCMGVDITDILVPKASCSQDQMIVGNQHVVDKTKSCGQQSNVDLLGDTNDDPCADKLMVSEDDIEERNTTGTNIILATDDATTGELSSSEYISTLKGIKKIPTIDTHHEQTSQKVEAVGNPKNIEIMVAPNDNEAMEVKRAASMDANTENGTNLTDNYEGSHMKNKKVSFASGTKLDSSDEEEEESLDEEEVEDGEDGEDREINNDGEDREINNDAEDGEINNDADGKADIIFQNKLRLGLGRIASRYAHENIVADTEPDSGSTEVAPSAEIAETSDGETTDNSLVERYMCTGEGVREVPCGETSPDEEVSNGDGDFIARYINDDTSINVSPEVSPVIKEKESSLQSAAEDNREGDSAAVGELDSGDVKIDQPNRREQLVALQHQIMRGLWSLEQERVREREQQDCDDQDDDIKEGEVTSSPAPLDMIQEEGQE